MLYPACVRRRDQVNLDGTGAVNIGALVLAGQPPDGPNNNQTAPALELLRK